MAEPPDVPVPAQRLAPAARWAWRASWLGGGVVAGLILAGASDALPDGWSGPLWILFALVLAVGVVVVPELRWRRWRWDVREGEIDLQRGVLVLRRTLIPMVRVQHVETERGVIGQALNLATVKIHTAAGSHEIPLLAEYDAGRLRARIAELARTADG
jgi:membrane protein YdbS with pleckstrin-like domain